MAKKIDIDGKRFGRIVALWHSYSVRTWYGNRFGQKDYYECICDCGRRKVAGKGGLLNGNTKSCGCLVDANRSSARKTHGDSNNPLYKTWAGIKTRCLNENSLSYKDYGGRGITICDRWKNSFAAFRDDMGPKPSPKHTVDRIDNNKGYEPSNCRWETRTTQMRNNRRNVRFEINGESKTLQEWCNQFGINRGAADTRLKLGWSIEETLGLIPYKRWSGAKHKSSPR